MWDGAEGTGKRCKIVPGCSWRRPLACGGELSEAIEGKVKVNINGIKYVEAGN